MPDELMDDLIRRVTEELRRPVPVSADFDARLAARLHVAPSRRPGSLAVAWAWLCRPRTVRLSPLGGLAVAAAAALVVVMVGRTRASRRDAPARALASAPAVAQDAPVVAAAGHGGAVMVRFVFLAPHAHSVAVAGDFNNWSLRRTLMRRVSSAGLWTVDVPLHPGRYTYTFVVDGTRWMADPAAPREIADDFGAPSSVLAVVAGGRT